MSMSGPEVLDREKDKLYVTDAELIRRMGVHRNVSAINFGANLFNALHPNGPAKFFKAIRREAVV
jgi:hypothetical protein